MRILQPLYHLRISLTIALSPPLYLSKINTVLHAASSPPSDTQPHSSLLSKHPTTSLVLTAKFVNLLAINLHPVRPTLITNPSISSDTVPDAHLHYPHPRQRSPLNLACLPPRYIWRP